MNEIAGKLVVYEANLSMQAKIPRVIIDKTRVRPPLQQPAGEPGWLP